MENMSNTHTLLLCIIFFSLMLNFVSGADILRANQSISDGNSTTTIVSADGTFELGFVSPGSSKNRYVGIWYKKISVKTMVWIANRDTPLISTTGSAHFKLDSKGNLVILNASDNVLWTSNSSKFVREPVLQLLDSGNLVIREENDSDPENYAWQSFDIFGNTLLPGGKFGWNLEAGLEWYFSSWKSEDDPSPGEYTIRIDRSGFPQMMTLKGSTVQFRAGPWNGVGFSGSPNLKPNPIYKFGFVINDKELYYHYEVIDASVTTRLTLNPDGSYKRYIWTEKSQSWTVYLTGQVDDCDRYSLCGANGKCNINKSPSCSCLDGFEPKIKKEWDVADWSSGCARKVQLNCADDEGFVKYSEMVLPDTKTSWYDRNMSLDECRSVCLKNCSCSAYANTDIRGSGCLLWFNELIDIRELDESGQDLYIRMPASELAKSETKRKKSKTWVIVFPILLVATMILGVTLWVIRKKKKKRTQAITTQYSVYDEGNDGDDDLELPIFDFATLSNATNGFSLNCKLGEGGFGPVYKGTLDDGREIAVKRLSTNSRQGLKEFKNEVSCIAQLQHRNLVKLLGCSVQEGEKLLVYEYMPNKSLDLFIFDIKQRETLDWPMRYNIIKGIARGLLYLHQDSRLRIIHRDLKASNVLLDHDMNPKISDFGTARIFQETDDGANTTKVVGTYGYMSPEYALEGKFSVKSDVYSFGVLLLEIVCGKRNKNITNPDHHLNLLGHAWRSYTDGRVLDLVDEVIAESSHQHEVEVIRAIRIGLLCVQHYSDDRPTMATVVLMLTSNIPLPQPNQPGFFTERNLYEKYPFPPSMPESSASSNYLSVTAMDPR